MIPKIKLSIKSVWKILQIPEYALRSAVYSLLVLFVLQWLFNISLLVGIFQQNPFEIPRILVEGYFNLFRFGFDIVPFYLVLIALFQGVSISIFRFVSRADKKKNTVKKSGLAFALFGSGCATCGGSIVAPIFSGLSTSSAFLAATLVRDLSLFVALIFAIYGLYLAGLHAAGAIARL